MHNIVTGHIRFGPLFLSRGVVGLLSTGATLSSFFYLLVELGLLLKNPLIICMNNYDTCILHIAYCMALLAFGICHKFVIFLISSSAQTISSGTTSNFRTAVHTGQCKVHICTQVTEDILTRINRGRYRPNYITSSPKDGATVL